MTISTPTYLFFLFGIVDAMPYSEDMIKPNM